MQAIAKSESTTNITWIFTDQQSSDESGSAVVADYRKAASDRGSTLYSIVVDCSLQENLRRLQAPGRGGQANTKLTDERILLDIRQHEDIYHFGGDMELEIDTTESSPSETARRIFDFIRQHQWREQKTLDGLGSGHENR